jgi:N-acyl-D-amino-acid deacylase
MSYDLLIKNGMVVDGTGTPRYRADIAVTNGRIAEIGTVGAGATNVIDASDLVVAPGFVDPHTHYDAQISWDPLCTSSSWHGITTVVMGNCGVGIAPCRTDSHEIVAWDLVNVEGIPFGTLSRGVTWDWETFPQFMEAAQRRGTGINLGFLAPLSPFRHFVMGEESMNRMARPEEMSRIRDLLREALAAGALGFSTTICSQHVGYGGRPLACRLSSHDELREYARVLKETGRGAIELSLTETVSVVSEEEYALLDMLLTESGRPVTWLSLSIRDNKGTHLDTLRKTEPLIKRGAPPQISCMPVVLNLELHEIPTLLAGMPSFLPALNKPVAAQKELYASGTFRAAFRKDLEIGRLFRFDWSTVELGFINNPKLEDMVGSSVQEIARRQGKDPVDTFLDIAIEDDLATIYTIVPPEPDGQAELINDPRALIGMADGGAHVVTLCQTGYTTYLLGTWSRERQAISLERAVKRITSEPAALFGLSDRGRLAIGLAADLVVFDYNTIGSNPRPEIVNDLPGGGRRLISRSRGVEYIIVNGELLYRNGHYSGALPGHVLRTST